MSRRVILPDNRNKIAPLRGLLADLQANTAGMMEGEISYAIDTNRHYTLISGELIEVGMDPTDIDLNTRAVRLAVPEGNIDNQEQANTHFAQMAAAADAGIQSNAEAIDSTREELEQEKAFRVTGDSALDERIKVLEDAPPVEIPETPDAPDLTPYVTKTELEVVDKKTRTNATDIEGLQEGFDAALIAAQEGSEKLSIELQGYAKKSETATKADLLTQENKWTEADIKVKEVAAKADSDIIAMVNANTDAINGIKIPEIPEPPGPDPRLPYVLEQGVAQSTERGIRKDASAEDLKTREAQTLETLTLRDGEGNAMGDIAFECANGIGVRWSTVYEGTLRITGENLQKQIEDADALLQQGIDANTAAIAAIDTSGEGPDLSGYALKTELPTDNKDLANGAGYITAADLPEPPAGGGADPSLPYALVVGETDSNTLPKSASDGVETTQILETITLQDASGNSLGDIHFESGYGIGVAMSTRHANTIYIQGASLQSDITANAEAIAALDKAISENRGGIDWDSLPELP